MIEKGKVLSNQPRTTTTSYDDHDGRLVDKYPYVSKWMARKPKVASGYVWIPLEQDKDWIVSLCCEGVEFAQELTLS